MKELRGAFGRTLFLGLCVCLGMAWVQRSRQAEAVRDIERKDLPIPRSYYKSDAAWENAKRQLAKSGKDHDPRG